MRDETHVNPRRSWCLPAVGLLTIALMVPAGCSGGGGGGGALPTSVQFIVENGAGMPVVAATVYLVPAGDIDDTPFDNSDVLSGASEDADEPLEDAIRLHGAGYIQGVTDVNGAVTLAGVPQGRYFWFVMPDDADTEHLPGGSLPGILGLPAVPHAIRFDEGARPPAGLHRARAAHAPAEHRSLSGVR
jgi:hypothetical protein